MTRHGTHTYKNPAKLPKLTGTKAPRLGVGRTWVHLKNRFAKKGEKATRNDLVAFLIRKRSLDWLQQRHRACTQLAAPTQEQLQIQEVLKDAIHVYPKKKKEDPS